MIRATLIVRAWLCLLLVTLSFGALAETSKILIVPSKDVGPYHDVAQAIRAGLANQPEFELRVLPLDTFRSIDVSIHRPALIVTVGVEAAQRVAQTNPLAAILHTLLPRETALELIRNGRGKHPSTYRDSAVFLDQPIGRQFDLIRLALPKLKRIAVLLGPSTVQQANELRQAARERGLRVDIGVVETRDTLVSTLEDLLEDDEVLLSVPDPLVYQSETIHHILLTTYRYRVPMVGLSKTYVDAGALLALYSLPEQIGHQVAQLISSPNTLHGPLPAPMYPKSFAVSVNRRIAASLDLYVEADAVLQRKLEGGTHP